MKRVLKAAVSALAAAALGGCAGVISKDLRDEAVPVKGLGQIRQDPQAFAGRTVILGGNILETRNEKESTTLVVLDKPLGMREEPEESDRSGGRFLVRQVGYLDPAVYAPGREVTVAGVVRGLETEPVGKAPYEYVTLEARQVYLWPKPRYLPAPAPYPPWYYPGYPYDGLPGWYDPTWGPPWWWDGAWPPPYRGDEEHEERARHGDRDRR